MCMCIFEVIFDMSVLWQRLICRKQIFVNNMLVGMCSTEVPYLHNKFVRVVVID